MSTSASPSPQRPTHSDDQTHILLEVARSDPSAAFAFAHATPAGLTDAEVSRRLGAVGPNALKAERPPTWYGRLLGNVRDPLSFLLIALGVVAYLTDDLKATVIIGAMLLLSVVLRFVQERRADFAVARLKAMVPTNATVVRNTREQEVPLASLVPGDIIHLAAGDMVPADIRVVESLDLFVNQAALTGESLPVEKHAPALPDAAGNPTDLANLCFMGTNVESGTATAVVLETGPRTLFGALAASLVEQHEVSAFDRGVSRFTWLMIRFIGVMVPLVFLLNGVTKGDWFQALLFAVAVAVGLTPELLPMIITVNLSKGALDMSRKRVIVKRLNALQNIGAMDILCTDKTGTLTEGRVTLIKYVNVEGGEALDVLRAAYLNSRFQTGLRNLTDVAVVAHAPADASSLERTYRKVDEIPFNFQRRRLSVVVSDGGSHTRLICKGAVDEILAVCTSVATPAGTVPLATFHHKAKDDIVETLSRQGFRLIAVAERTTDPSQHVFRSADERDLTLLGFLAFYDPPKQSAGAALARLARDGVAVKILTGDNELVTRKICGDVGLAIQRIIRGDEVETLDDDALGSAAEEATVFDKLQPAQKVRVITALQRRGHVVGFLGDGINDAPALKAADVGTSVDTAADIARDSSDVILLEKSLAVLHDAILDGRRVFGNIVKYIKMTASSNFGNMLSVVGASVFLPFLPMLPLQIIVNNLLYDLSQITIPTDRVDPEEITKPRAWRIDSLERFIMTLGPVSSLFDYLTFGLLIVAFGAWTNPALFQTGWFVESLVSQTFVIHLLRTNRLPFFQSRPSLPLALSSIAIVALGAWLPFSPLADALGFVALPALYWPALVLLLVAYFFLAHVVKRSFVRRYGF